MRDEGDDPYRFRRCRLQDLLCHGARKIGQGLSEQPAGPDFAAFTFIFVFRPARWLDYPALFFSHWIELPCGVEVRCRGKSRFPRRFVERLTQNGAVQQAAHFRQHLAFETVANLFDHPESKDHAQSYEGIRVG